MGTSDVVLRVRAKNRMRDLNSRYGFIDDYYTHGNAEFSDMDDQDVSGNPDGLMKNGNVIINISRAEKFMPGETDGREETLVHELTHVIQWKHMKTAWDSLKNSIPDEVPEDERCYDIRNAHLEATAYFEADPEAVGSNREMRERLSKPSGAKDYLAELLRDEKLNPPEKRASETGVFDDPHLLGRLAANAIYLGFEEQHDNPERLTREFLMNCVTTPAGLEGMIDRSLEMRDLPPYLDIFDRYWRELEVRKRRDLLESPEEYVENTSQQILNAWIDQEIEIPDIDFNYEISGLKEAYREFSGEEPEELFPDELV